MSPEQIQGLANLPLYVILLIAVASLWRSYAAVQNARVEDLKLAHKEMMFDLRTRIVLLEARMGLEDAPTGSEVIPGAKLT